MKRRYLSVLILACAVRVPAQECPPPVPAAQDLPPLRAEGQTELISDRVLTVCGRTPTPAGMQVPTGTICFDPRGYTITSRTLPGSSDNGPLFTEALVIAGNPPPEEQFLCEAPNNSCVNYAGSKSNKNVFRAKLTTCPLDPFQGRQVLVWENIPVDPGVDNKATLRLTNVRVDATSAKPPGPFNVILLIGNFSLAQQGLMETARASLDFSVRQADSDAPLTDVFALQLCAELPQTRIATLRFAELLPGAFRPRNPAAFTTPEQSPDPVDNAGPFSPFTTEPFTTETGFYNHRFGSGAVQPGLPDNGDRVRVTFSNIPPGARIFVDAVNSFPTSFHTARLVDGNSVPFRPLGAALDRVELDVVNGSAVATWEVLGNDPSVANNLDFGVYLSYSPMPGATPDQLLQGITVQGGYAPPASLAEIPSFPSPSTALPPIALVRLVPCLTITTASPLPPGVASATYSLQLTALGGDGLTWTSSGTLPPGLTLDAAGRLSGTLTKSGLFCFDVTAASGILRTTATLCILITELRILTLGKLRVEAIVGREVPPNPLQAYGGAPPYKWSIVPGSLPPGITLNTDGTFAGQTNDDGEFRVTVQVSDSSVPTVSQPGQVVLTVLPLATAIISAMPDAADPNGTQAIQVMLQNNRRDIVVALTAHLQPSSALAVPVNSGAEDQEVGFPDGQTTTFRISADSTSGGPSGPLRTGTVAGDIVLNASLNLLDGRPIGSVAQKVETVPLMRPAITDLKLQSRTGGFDVCVTGFATNREVTSATFDFQPAPGVKLQGNLATVPVGPVFEAAYRQKGSGVFFYVQSFQLEGNISDIASVTVTLANSRSEGPPEISTRKADFPAGSVCQPPI